MYRKTSYMDLKTTLTILKNTPSVHTEQESSPKPLPSQDRGLCAAWAWPFCLDQWR